MTPRHKPPTVNELSTHNKFKSAERFYKNRNTPLDLSTVFNCSAITWNDTHEGVWECPRSKRVVYCRRERMLLSSLLNEGTTTNDEEDDDIQHYAIIIPAIPGLVLAPNILTHAAQRDLIRISLRSAALPNLTSLSAHYELPNVGVWTAYESGRGDELLERTDGETVTSSAKRKGIDFEPVNVDNWTSAQVNERRIEKEVMDRVIEKRSETIAALVQKLRWVTLGWQYNWTSKTYLFDRPPSPVPNLIQTVCRNLVRAVPWSKVFAAGDMTDDIERWKDDYQPDGGVVNFYQLKDSLTAHVDASEVDATRPLVSFSLGHSAIFLIGGDTRDSEDPLPILLSSGDGLMMSGPGRRLFHGLPRIVERSLPSFLASTTTDDDRGDWKLFGEYLERGARINLNVRQVFPS